MREFLQSYFTNGLSALEDSVKRDPSSFLSHLLPPTFTTGAGGVAKRTGAIADSVGQISSGGAGGFRRGFSVDVEQYLRENKLTGRIQKLSSTLTFTLL